MSEAERSSRQVVVVSGSFLSETGEAAALLWLHHEQGSSGGDVRERGGVDLIKVTHCLNSLHPHTRTHQFVAVLLQVGYPINATQISTRAT